MQGFTEDKTEEEKENLNVFMDQNGYDYQETLDPTTFYIDDLIGTFVEVSHNESNIDKEDLSERLIDRLMSNEQDLYQTYLDYITK